MVIYLVVLRKMVRFIKQKNNFPKWMDDVKILPIWDDHDYGLNDAGSEYPLRDNHKRYI